MWKCFTILILLIIFSGCLGDSSGKNMTPSSHKPFCSGCNVVLISVEAFRTDHVGCYGYSRNTTFYIDQIADKGIVFRNAYSSAPWTYPSLITLMSSQHPTTHGLTKAKYLPQNEKLFLNTFLKSRNYSTSAFVVSAIPTIQTVFEPSFDKYARSNSVKDITSWVDSERQNNFFMWIHFFKPHTPYKAEPRYDGFFINESTKELRAYSALWRPGKSCDKWYYNGTEE
ncbi:MAG: sulfatase-like hydrolase/transferase, partial [Candidatus Altiarchaeota archaeon]|nr:sulfatase-like hydrolase/transferase [Candidatus Altiarchaeota archaeon]